MAGFGLHEGEEEVSKRQKLPVTEQETGKLRKPQSWGSGTRLPKTETQSKRTRNLLLPSKILHQVISKSCLPLAKGPEHKERFPLWCMHARMRVGLLRKSTWDSRAHTKHRVMSVRHWRNVMLVLQRRYLQQRNCNPNRPQTRLTQWMPST